MITFKCPGCGLIHRAAADFGGIRAKCLCCGNVMRVPSGTEGAEANLVDGPGSPRIAPRRRRPASQQQSRSDKDRVLDALAEGEAYPLEEPGAYLNGEPPAVAENTQPELDTPPPFPEDPAPPPPVKGRSWVKWALGGGVAAVLATAAYWLFQPGADKPVPLPPAPKVAASVPKSAPKPAPAPKPVTPPPKPAPVVPPIQLTAARLAREHAWDTGGTNKLYRGRTLELQGIFIRLDDAPPPPLPRDLFRLKDGPLPPHSPGRRLLLSGGVSGLVSCRLAAARDAAAESLQPGEAITVRGTYWPDLRLEQASVVRRGAPADLPYKGKDPEVSGMIVARGWADGFGTLELGVERTDTPLVRLECRFRASEYSNLDWLTPGRFVTVRGVCTGRNGRTVRVDNSRLVLMSVPPAGAVRVTARQLLEDYGSDLRDGDEEREPPLPVTAMDLVWQVQKEGTAALHRYYHRRLIVSGNVERVVPREQRVVFERDTQQRMQAAAIFSPREFQQLGLVKRLSILGVFAGLDGKLVRLDNCRHVDSRQPMPGPEKDEWLTLDYWPFRPGRTLIYDTVVFNGPLGKTAVRQEYRFSDKDTITVTNDREGTFRGKSLLDAAHPGKLRWTTHTGKHHVRWHYRFESGNVEIGTPPAKNPKGPPVWEPILSLGLTKGDHWEWTDPEKHRVTYTVEGFRADGTRRLVTIRKTEQINAVTVDTVSTFAAGVGEIEHYTEAHSADKKATRRLSETKLVSDEPTPPAVKNIRH